ncbi:MAG: peptide chain release factor 1 [Gemmatimonadota bacterium]|jgi:peptide chain release factor 1|nr:peptide chain release factor 1 [Gemmatimonadota bacterium]
MDDRIREVVRRYEEISSLLADPAVINDQSRLREVAREHAQLSETVAAITRRDSILSQLKDARELLGEAAGDPEMEAFASGEVSRLEAESGAGERDLKRLLMPRDPLDDRDAVVEIRAGTGGDEAALFAGDLFRMYTRFAEGRGWRVELLATSEGGAGGVKEAIFAVRGANAYGDLRYESGVHRVQRIPATENQGRIHTSAATVAVLPEAEEVDVRIEEGDLRIDVYRSSGPGGQSVNTTDSAVRITHLPTGLVVTCQDEKSQHKNRDKALSVLRSRLLDMRVAEQEAERARDRKLQVGTGDRSAKIRTYNFPQSRVTDHRIGFTTHALPQVLDGELEDLIERLRLAGQEERAA